MPPAPFGPMPEDHIQFIEQWIDDGCPSELSASVSIDPSAGGGMDPVLHNHYWRQFDNWATRGGQIGAHVGVSFGLRDSFARGAITEAEFIDQAREPAVQTAVEFLAARQAQSVESHYGNPVPLLSLLESYELFGRGIDHGGLPADPLRPGSPHQMNGRQMWFKWCAMAEATQRLPTQLQPEFWQAYARAILLGLLNDGVIRGRFPVDGFAASDPDVSNKMRDHVTSVAADQLFMEMRQRFANTSLTLPFEQ